MQSAQELEKLVVRLTGDGTGYLRMINEAVNATTNAARKIQAAGNSMQMLGAKMTIGVALPVTGMIKAYANFEDAMTKSTAIMTGVDAELRREMEETAISIARNSITSAHKVAEAYYFLGSAGLDARQSMAALSTVEKFATAGAFDMATATDLLADSQSALGMRASGAAENLKQMIKVADTLVKANILSNASVEQFSEAITNDAGAAIKQYNIDLEEGIAILAAYADQGTKGVAAGSQMGRLIKLLIKSINDNGKEFKKLNIEYDEFAETGKNVTGVIEGIAAAVASMGPAQKAATLEKLGFESLVQQALLPLLGATEKIREYEEALKSAGGTTDEVATKQLKSFTSQMLILWNRIKEVSLIIGEELSPYVKWLSDKLSIVIAWFRSLNDQTQKVVATVIGFVAILGPLLTLFGTMLTSIGFLVISLNAIWGSLLKVIAFFKGTKAAATETAISLDSLGVSAIAADTTIASVTAAANICTPSVLALSAAVDKLALSFKTLQASKAAAMLGRAGAGASALALTGPAAAGAAGATGAAGAAAMGGVIDVTATVIGSTEAMGASAVAASTAAKTASMGVLATFGWWVVAIAGVVLALKMLVDWVNGPGSFTKAIKDAGKAMVDFASKSIGFIANIGTNWGLLIPWLKDNWFNLLIDMGKAWMTYTSNMISNAGTAFNTLVRLVTYTAGAITAKIGDVFSIDFPMLIVTGLEKAAELFNGFVTKIAGMWESIKNWDFSSIASAGDNLLGWLADAGDQLNRDFDAGKNDESYLTGMAGILKEQVEAMKGPLEGFESSTSDLPDFVTDIFKQVEDETNKFSEDQKNEQENVAFDAAKKTGGVDVAANDFKQMSLNQFSVAAIGGTSKPVKKQEVTDSVVASKLDDLIGVTKMKKNATLAR